MKALAVVVVLVSACGGGPKPPPASPATHNVAAGSGSGSGQQAPTELTVEAVCKRLETLRRTSCGGFAQMRVTPQACPSVFEEGMSGPDRKNKRVLTSIARCMVENPACDDVLGCMAKIAYDDPNDLRACSDPADNRAAGLPAAEWARRPGAGVKTFRTAKSTKEHPMEVCGVRASTEWLTTLACEDGSHPLKTSDDAEAARAGNVGAGGRCGSIVDLYRVSCPEGMYEVYVDGYVCPLPGAPSRPTEPPQPTPPPQAE